MPNKTKMNSPERCEEEEEEEEEEESHFDRLPDELIITVFDKLRRLKSLRACSLACKRFSTLTHLVRHVLLSIPAHATPEALFYDTGVSEPPDSFRSCFSSFPPIDRRSLALCLSKFTELRSVELELSLGNGGGVVGGDYVDYRSLVVRWKAAFGVGLEAFVVLGATSVRETNQFPDDDTGGRGGGAGFFGFINLWERGGRLALLSLEDAMLRRMMLLFLAEEFPRLRTIAVSDSEGRDLIAEGGERLAEVRRTMKSQTASFEGPKTMRYWCVPATLRLPLSRCVMEGATLFMMRMGDEDSTGGDDDCSDGVATRPGLFESGEEVFAEAVREIMVNPNSRMKKLRSG